MRRHQRFVLRQAMAACALALFLLVGGTPAAGGTAGPEEGTGSSPASGSTASPGVTTCQYAEELTEAGQPGRALDLLERLRGEGSPTEDRARGEHGAAACAPARDEALAQVARAERLARAVAAAGDLDEARAKAQEPDSKERLESAERGVQRALPDVDLAERTLPDDLTCGDGAAAGSSADTYAEWIAAAARACDTEVEIPARDEDPTDSERAETSWEDFLTRHVLPLAAPVTGAAALLPYAP